MKTAAEQYHLWKISAETSDGFVLITMRNPVLALTPEVAKQFAWELVGAYYHAKEEAKEAGNAAA